MKKVLVTPRSLTRDGHPALKMLTDAGYEVIYSAAGVQPGEEELISLLNGCVGWLAGVEKIDAKVLESAKNLKVITRNGIGIDNIDLEAAKKLDIAVIPAIGAVSRGVAELTIGLMICLTRQISFSDRHLKKTNWQRKKGVEIIGKTLGIVGCGSIGKLVAELALGMGMKVVAYDPFKDASFRPSDDFKYAKLDELLAQADIVTFHCPASKDGKAIINKDSLSKMKDGVFIINAARPALLDQADTLEALDSGKIAGLSIDVYDVEPPGDDPLVMHESVLATPHIGSFTAESQGRSVYAAVTNMIDYLKNI